jgi:hypothetical protein
MADHSTPEVLTRQLERLRGRLRGISVAGGIGLTAFVTALLLGAALLLDLAFALPSGLRTGLLLGGIVVFVAMTAWTVVLPLIRLIREDELAAFVETAYPEFDERLLSAIEFASEPEQTERSPVMQQWMLEQTVELAREVEFADAIDARPAVRRCWLGTVAMIALLLPLVFAGNAYGVLVSRFFNPWGNHEQIQNLMLTVVEGDRVVPARSDVTFEVAVDWRFSAGTPPESAWLEWIGERGKAERRRLDWDDERESYVGLRSRVEESFTYSVSAGRTRSRDYRIDVVERPEVREFAVDIVPPAYTGEPARRHDAVVGEIIAIEQSQLEFTASFNKPVERAELLWIDPVRRRVEDEGEEEEGKRGRGEEGTREQPHPSALGPRTAEPIESLPNGTPVFHRTELPLNDEGTAAALTRLAELDAPSGRFLLRVTDEHGLSSELISVRRLTIAADEAPYVQFADREQSAEARPDDLLEIPVQALDDFGLAELELHYEFTRTGTVTETGVIPAPPEVVGRRGVQHTFRLDLAPLKLKTGIQVAIKARATDERPVPGPNESWSETRIISIKEDAKPYGDQTLAEQQHRTEQVIDALKAEVEKQRQQAEELQEQARENVKQEQPFKKEEELQAMQERLEELEQQLEQLGAMFQQQPLFDDLARQAREIAQQQLSEAAEQARQAEQADLKQKPEHLGQTADQLKQASQDLSRMQQDYQKMADLQRDLLELNRLAAHTERLADNVADMEQRQQEIQAASDGPTEQEQRQLEMEQRQLIAEHQQLERGLEDLTDRRPELLDAARRDLFQRLDEIGQRADDLARMQQELAKASQRSANEQANQFRPLRDEQQQLLNETEKLARDHELPTPEDGPAPAGIDAMKQARQALQDAELGNALDRQQQAIGDLNELAESVADGQEQLAEALRNLAERQQDLADRVADATAPMNVADQNRNGQPQEASDATPPDPSPPAPSQPETSPANPQLLAEQRRLAELAERLGEQVQSLNLEQETVEDASRRFPESARHAADAGQRLDFPNLAERSRQAAESARELAESLGNEPAPQPLQQAAEAAAARQEQLADQFTQLADSPAAQREMRSQLQEQVRQASDRLAGELDETAGALGAHPLNEQEPAQRSQSSRESARQASQSATQAGTEAQRGNQRSASESSRQAGEQLRQAARDAQQAARQNPVTGKRDQENKVPGEVGQQVAQAARQLSEAGRQLAQFGQPMGEPQPEDAPSEAPDDAQQAMGDEPADGEPLPGGEDGQLAEMSAAEALRQAAQSMRQAAGELGRSMSQPPSQSDQQPGEDSPSSDGGDEANEFGGEQLARLLELEVELGQMTQRDWGKLTGELETELRESSQRRPDGEYARLIRRYFQEISKSRTPGLTSPNGTDEE